MIHYKLAQKVAYMLAAGLYRDIGSFIAAARRDNPEDYERFKNEYLAKETKQTSSHVKRRHIRNRPIKSR
ncbi:hypothetical protein Desaci_4558 [Desulfosporosinus acidiphilus SJ4]|uniref:Uncharacterized protein n=1 Tax=Desulfosporosinus acidiphilus (strain DSM 22704 / JCM 16185 / SJ4) TaxID=646529 RepID=I4DC73_DESAJ|nr:hypothetical protein [Desulfosporosinus acidiphilus]AFM43397.1 hypothetical protein Desaci_4558 [Desulfosporosinus acidiphilus SJ4]